MRFEPSVRRASSYQHSVQYVNAEALLEHLGNVAAMLEATMKLAELIRIEVHGPAAELEKLKEPLAHLNPAWFVLH